MSDCVEMPYGAWKSPITAEMIVENAIRFQDLALDGDDLYWSEMRPNEGGRYVIVHHLPDGRIEDVTPPEFNARTRVHEYGGGAFVVDNGLIIFANFADQRLYTQRLGEIPQPLTPPGYRYADGIVDRDRNRLICVREDHTQANGQPINTIVAVDISGDGGNDNEDAGVVLASGYDFYSTPRLDPAGRHLVWLAWNHPEMPWTNSELWTGEVGADGAVHKAQRIAGGPGESIFQPAWSPEGQLHFVSDRTGWWNLYCWQGGKALPLAPMAAEFGRAQWVFGIPTYGFADAERLICSYTANGEWHLAEINAHTGAFKNLDLPYTSVSSVHVNSEAAFFVAGSPSEPSAVVRFDLVEGTYRVVRRSSQAGVDVDYLSEPRPIEFPTESGLSAHGIYYPPRNPAFRGIDAERPPLLVMCHGGPTGSTSSVLDIETQFWTSRGFAVLDVNYGGSTGYGRDYRKRLDGQWGVVDVDDCCNGARYLVEQGDVDGNRLIIRGGSAGGYTTLAVLTFRKVFRAGASYYGISDLKGLATDTHKFESRYLDGLIGPYPERRDLYLARSPLYHAGRLACPLIFFQGLEDKVVLPAQAELMVDALRQKGVPVAYLPFEGEQHGFRQAKNIRRAVEAELYFYGQVFGFPLADPVEPVEIENLPAQAALGRHHEA